VEFIEPKIQTSEMIENYRQWKAAVARARFNSNTSEER